MQGVGASLREHTQPNIFGKIGDAVSSGLGAVGDFVGGIPGIGDELQRLLPGAAALIPGLGPVASGVLGAILGSGENGIGALQGAGLAGGGRLLRNVFDQQQQARDRAQRLVDSAVGREREQFRFGEPLRQEFRASALNFFDPTNPFSRAGPITDTAARTAGIGRGLPGVSQRAFGAGPISSALGRFRPQPFAFPQNFQFAPPPPPPGEAEPEFTPNERRQLDQSRERGANNQPAPGEARRRKRVPVDLGEGELDPNTPGGVNTPEEAERITRKVIDELNREREERTTGGRGGRPRGRSPGTTSSGGSRRITRTGF